MKLPPIHLPLLLVKAGVFVLALGLDLAGKLSPSVAQLSMALIVALGGTHIAAMLKAPPVSSDVIDKLSSLLIAFAKQVTPPAPPPTPTAPSVPTAAKIVGAAMLGSFMACLAFCTPAHTAAEDKDVAAYAQEQITCVDGNDSRVTIDACRAASRARFCVKYPSALNCGDASR